MTTATIIDFRPFLGREDNRHGLTLPRLQGGKLFASDGRCAVALDEFEYDGPWPDDQAKPDFTTIFAPLAEVKEWRDVPRVEDCPLCGNTRYLPTTTVQCSECTNGTADCPECEGTGFVECDYGHEHDCKDCGGGGDVDCDTCDGDGTVTDEPLCECAAKSVWLFDRRFDASLLRRFRDLPDVQCGMGGWALFFRFTGGAGVLMPMADGRPHDAR